MAEESEKTEIRKITAEELDATYEFPATAVNRFFATVGSQGTRIAFAEQYQLDKKAHVRSVVIMTHQDAIALWKLLQGLLTPIEKDLNAEKGKSDG